MIPLRRMKSGINLNLIRIFLGQQGDNTDIIQVKSLQLGMQIFNINRGYNYYVYIVLCTDGSYYTGVTNDIDRRVKEHNIGFDTDSYTYMRRPVELKYIEQFDDIDKAIQKEKQIKGWSKKKKEALIEENCDLLKKYSKKKWK